MSSFCIEPNGGLENKPQPKEDVIIYCLARVVAFFKSQ